MHRIEKTKKLHDRLDRYNRKRYSAKRKKLREDVMVGEKVLVLAERVRKKAAPGKFYKPVQNISYINKNRTFIMRKIQPINSIKYYCLKDAENNKKVVKRFQRTELFAVRGNFVT